MISHFLLFSLLAASIVFASGGNANATVSLYSASDCSAGKHLGSFHALNSTGECQTLSDTLSLKLICNGRSAVMFGFARAGCQSAAGGGSGTQFDARAWFDQNQNTSTQCVKFFSIYATVDCGGPSLPSLPPQLASVHLESRPRELLIPTGTLGNPLIVMDPMVLADPNESHVFHLFYSTYLCMDHRNGEILFLVNGNCSLIDSSVIGYGYSEDFGVTWQLRDTPVFTQAIGQEWDSFKIETCFVHLKGDTLALFYAGLGYINGKLYNLRYSIGVAFFDLKGRSIRDSLLDGSDEFVRRTPNHIVPLDTEHGMSMLTNSQEPSLVALPDGSLHLFYTAFSWADPLCYDAPSCLKGGFAYVGLGRIELDDSLNMIGVSQVPLPGTMNNLNIPEVHFIPERGLFLMLSVDFQKTGHLFRNCTIYASWSVDGDSWTYPISISDLSGPSGTIGEHGEAANFKNWGTTSPTFQVLKNGTVLVWMSTVHTISRGKCNPDELEPYRMGIHVEDDSCATVSLSRASFDLPSTHSLEIVDLPHHSISMAELIALQHNKHAKHEN